MGDEEIEPTVVIGFEPSDEGRDALALGAELARAAQARAVVAHAIRLPRGVLRSGDPGPEFEAAVTEELAAAVDAIPSFEPEVRTPASTSASRGLHELATELSASLLVVGSTGRGPLGGVLAGSTGERLLHGSPCAVTVAARGYAATGARLLRLAVAFDGSAEASLALSSGIELARRCNSTFTLFTVARTPSLAEVAGAPPVPLSEAEPAEQRHRRRVLDAGLSRVPDDLPVQGHLLHGPPGEMLTEVSADFDLMLVGSRGYGPLRSTLLGSTARHLFGAAACSVMAVPRGARSGPIEAVGG